MIRVKDSELDMTSNLLTLWNGLPFTGIAYESYEYAEKEYLLSEMAFTDGMQDGPARDWYYLSEQIESEAHYLRGLLHGISREWSQTGQLLVEAEYEYSVLVYKRIWNEEGLLIDRFEVNKNDAKFQNLIHSRRKWIE